MGVIQTLLQRFYTIIFKFQTIILKIFWIFEYKRNNLVVFIIYCKIIFIYLPPPTKLWLASFKSNFLVKGNYL